MNEYDMITVSNGTRRQVCEKLNQLNFDYANILCLNDFDQLVNISNLSEHKQVMFMFLDNVEYISKFLDALTNLNLKINLRNVSFYFDNLLDSNLHLLDFNLVLCIINNVLQTINANGIKITNIKFVYINDSNLLEGKEVSLASFIRNWDNIEKIELTNSNKTLNDRNLNKSIQNLANSELSKNCQTSSKCEMTKTYQTSGNPQFSLFGSRTQEIY